MYAVQFGVTLNTIHHRPTAMIRLANRWSLWVCAQFCTVFAENDESPGSHEPTERKMH